MAKVVLAITGGIAAYKAAVFARELIKAGHEVRVVMTEGAKAFITPLTLQALTGNEVHDALLDPKAEAGMGHIELAKWAELLVIAPASANTLARLAAGMADDLLATICLATAAPVLVAPAMNQQMWAHPAVQLNVQTLKDLGYHLIDPDSGVQACGDVGAGRLPEPEQLLEHVQFFMARMHTPQVLAGKNVTITAGPTVEAIDPVRYLSNHSSGKMGFALATACRNAGANVTLIAGGKVTLPTPYGVHRIDVLSAQEMLDVAHQCAKGLNFASFEVAERLGLQGQYGHHDHDHDQDHHHHEAHHECDGNCGHDHHSLELNNSHAGLSGQQATDIFIATAAVADYRTREAAPQKIKKTQEQMVLDLVKNPDILATISHEYPEIFMVGFAAETQDVEKYARGKLTAKQLDMIACNDVSRSDIGFASDDNVMTVFFADEHGTAPVHLDKANKLRISEQLVALMGQTLSKR